MLAKKIIFFSVVATIIGLIIYFLTQCQGESKKHVTVVFFESEKSDMNRVVKEIANQIPNPESFDLRLVFQPNSKNNVDSTIEIPAMTMNPDDFKKIIRDLLDKNAKNLASKMEPAIANAQFASANQVLQKAKPNVTEILILIGEIPNYSLNDSKDVIAQINGFNDSANKVVVWLMKSNDKRPERGILTAYKKKLKVDDKEIPIPDIKKDNNYIDIVAFSNIDSVHLEKLISDVLKTKDTNSVIEIRIPSLSHQGIENKDSQSIASKIREWFGKIKNNITFEQSQQQWRQELGDLEQDSNSFQRKIYFTGKFSVPKTKVEKKSKLDPDQIGVFTNKRQKETLAKNKSLEIIVALTDKKQRNDAKSAFEEKNIKCRNLFED